MTVGPVASTIHVWLSAAAGVAGGVDRPDGEGVRAVNEASQLGRAGAGRVAPGIELALEAGDTRADAAHERVVAAEGERRAGRVGQTVWAGVDRGRRARVVDRVDRTGGIAVAGTWATQRVADEIEDRVVVDQVESDRPVIGRRGGHGVDARATGHAGDRGGGEAAEHEVEVARVDAGDRLAERDRPGDRVGVRRAAGRAEDRDDRRRAGIDDPRVARREPDVANTVRRADVEGVRAGRQRRVARRAGARRVAEAVDLAFGAGDAGRDATHGRIDRREVEARAGGARRIGREGADRNGRLRLVDRVDLAREVAVAGAGAAKRVAGDIDDRVVVDQVESDGPVTGRRCGHGVDGRPAGDGRDGGRDRAGVGEAEVGRVDAGDGHREGDRPGERIRIGRRGAHADDRAHRRRRCADREGACGAVRARGEVVSSSHVPAVRPFGESRAGRERRAAQA